MQSSALAAQLVKESEWTGIPNVHANALFYHGGVHVLFCICPCRIVSRSQTRREPRSGYVRLISSDRPMTIIRFIYHVTESELSLLFWQGLLFTKQMYLAILELECSEKQVSVTSRSDWTQSS